MHVPPSSTERPVTVWLAESEWAISVGWISQAEKVLKQQSLRQWNSTVKSGPALSQRVESRHF